MRLSIVVFLGLCCCVFAPTQTIPIPEDNGPVCAQWHSCETPKSQNDVAPKPKAGKPPKNPKAPKTPTQPDIQRECVTVSNIYSHRLGLGSGIWSAQPGLSALVYNGCNTTVSIF